MPPGQQQPVAIAKLEVPLWERTGEPSARVCRGEQSSFPGTGESAARERNPLLPPPVLGGKEAIRWVVSCSSDILTGTSTKPGEKIATEAVLSLH